MWSQTAHSDSQTKQSLRQSDLAVAQTVRPGSHSDSQTWQSLRQSDLAVTQTKPSLRPGSRSDSQTKQSLRQPATQTWQSLDSQTWQSLRQSDGKKEQRQTARHVRRKSRRDHGLRGGSCSFLESEMIQTGE